MQYARYEELQLVSRVLEHACAALSTRDNHDGTCRPDAEYCIRGRSDGIPPPELARREGQKIQSGASGLS